jgi:hypothetical protein
MVLSLILTFISFLLGKERYGVSHIRLYLLLRDRSVQSLPMTPKDFIGGSMNQLKRIAGAGFALLTMLCVLPPAPKLLHQGNKAYPLP